MADDPYRNASLDNGRIVEEGVIRGHHYHVTSDLLKWSSDLDDPTRNHVSSTSTKLWGAAGSPSSYDIHAGQGVYTPVGVGGFVPTGASGGLGASVVIPPCLMGRVTNILNRTPIGVQWSFAGIATENHNMNSPNKVSVALSGKTNVHYNGFFDLRPGDILYAWIPREDTDLTREILRKLPPSCGSSANIMPVMIPGRKISSQIAEVGAWYARNAASEANTQFAAATTAAKTLDSIAAENGGARLAVVISGAHVGTAKIEQAFIQDAFSVSQTSQLISQSGGLSNTAKANDAYPKLAMLFRVALEALSRIGAGGPENITRLASFLSEANSAVTSAANLVNIHCKIGRVLGVGKPGGRVPVMVSRN